MDHPQQAALPGDGAFGNINGAYHAVPLCANLRGGDSSPQLRLPGTRLQNRLRRVKRRLTHLPKGREGRFLFIEQPVHGGQLLLLHACIHAHQQVARAHRLSLDHIDPRHPARLKRDERLLIRVGDNALHQRGTDQVAPLHRRGAHGRFGRERQQKQRGHGYRRGRNRQQGRLGFRHACVSSLPAPHGALKGYCGLFAGCEPWQVHAARASFNKRRRASRRGGAGRGCFFSAWTCSDRSAGASCGYRSAFH